MAEEYSQDLKSQVELTSAAMLHKLRNIVSPPGKKGTWMRYLSDLQLAEVFHRLRLRQSPNYICKIAQNDWGVQPRSEIKSMARAVRALRNDVIGDLRADEGKRTEEKKKEVARLTAKGKRISDRLDGMKRLAWLINIETDRVRMLYSKEKASMPFRHTEKTIEILADLLDKYMRLQIDLGLVESKPQPFQVAVMNKFTTVIGDMKASGAPIVDATNHFLALLNESAIPMESIGKPDEFVPVTYKVEEPKEKKEECERIEDLDYDMEIKGLEDILDE